MSVVTQLSVPACSQAPLGQSCCCCKRCNIGGCDLKVLDCGCCFHTRCFPIHENMPMELCPLCLVPLRSVILLPMVFDEIDQAQREAAAATLSDKRGKKRKNATIARLNAMEGDGSELRTGRWTTEETAYCDLLIDLFEKGSLPIPDGIKLNDFLSNMLKSKQSRLTKKMKNARLSARQYKREQGYIVDDAKARELSILETEFFASIRCNMERSEIRFHMQKEWRDLFSDFCLNIGRKLDANDWLHSIEELDRRISSQKDAARSARRKVMMGCALRQDAMNSQHGVFIDSSGQSVSSADMNIGPIATGYDSDADNSRRKRPKTTSAKSTASKQFSSAFLGKILDYMQRHFLPFEYVDIWVPSFVPAAGESSSNEQKCRLCFAGSGTTDTVYPPDGGSPCPLSAEDLFDLLSFGEYSQKFSFDVGSGLPGRVYVSGVASWEQGIQNAPTGLFERKGGAVQWGIQTVLGVPVPSPNVGRIVVVLYSRHDRPKDHELVNRLADELTRLMPAPRWKLVVDIGSGTPSSLESTDFDSDNEMRGEISELENIIQANMPQNQHSPFASFLPGFASLRLLLRKRNRTDHESELLQSALQCFFKNKQASQSGAHVAAMTARDFMVLNRRHRDVSIDSSPSHTVRTDDQSGHDDEKDLTHMRYQNQHVPSIRNTNLSDLPKEGRNDDVELLDSRSSLDFSFNASQGLYPIMASPSLFAVPASQDEIPMNMTASQLNAILQNDAINYQGM